MRISRTKGNTMALYACFIALVGVPLMMMCGDVTRAYAARIRLVNATEAACEAYANTLDVENFQETLETRVDDKALGIAWTFFAQGAPRGAYISFTNRTMPSEKNAGKEILVAQCRGGYVLKGIFQDYGMSHFASAQSRFGTTRNWP
jgi:hypothetical protein